MDDECKDTVSGWVILPGHKNTELTLSLEVRDKKGYVRCFPLKKEQREDVARHFDNWDYLYAGFRGSLYLSDFAKGKLKARLLVKTESGDVTGLSDLTFVNPGFEPRANRLNLAVIGGMAPAKGSTVVKELICRDLDVNWFIFGNLGDEELRSLRRPNLFLYGSYQREELAYLLRKHKIDCVLIPAIWPETFSYTLTEALLADTPVMVSDLGALGERVRVNQCGLVVQGTCWTDAFTQEIEKLIETPTLLEKYKKNAISYTEKTLKEMCTEYISCYEEGFREVAHGAYNGKRMFQAIV